MIKPMMAKCIPVSAIIPCYRCSRTIERAIASVAAQTRPPNEVILVDDGSSDGTLEVIRDLGRQYPLEWIRIIDLPQNVGPGKARNIGWDAARQPIIAFLDADDVWHPQKLEIQYHWMMNHPDVVLTGHGYRLISERSAAAGPPEYWQASRIPPYRFLLKNPFSTPSAMLQRDLPYRFDTEKGHSEDYLLWSIIGLNGYPVWYLDFAPCLRRKSGIWRIWSNQKPAANGSG